MFEWLPLVNDVDVDDVAVFISVSVDVASSASSDVSRRDTLHC